MLYPLGVTVPAGVSIPADVIQPCHGWPKCSASERSEHATPEALRKSIGVGRSAGGTSSAPRNPPGVACPMTASCDPLLSNENCLIWPFEYVSRLLSPFLSICG